MAEITRPKTPAAPTTRPPIRSVAPAKSELTEVVHQGVTPPEYQKLADKVSHMEAMLAELLGRAGSTIPSLREQFKQCIEAGCPEARKDEMYKIIPSSGLMLPGLFANSTGRKTISGKITYGELWDAYATDMKQRIAGFGTIQEMSEEDVKSVIDPAFHIDALISHGALVLYVPED
jgi:hypothetical protein